MADTPPWETAAEPTNAPPWEAASAPKSTKTTWYQDAASGFAGGIENVGNVVKDVKEGNFIGAGKPSPETEALANKIMPKGWGAGTFTENLGDLLYNIKNNVKPEDLSKALMERSGHTVPGEAANAYFGINPVTNLAGTLYSRNVAPKIEEITGIGPATQNILALGTGRRAVEKTGIGKLDPIPPAIGMAADMIKKTPGAIKSGVENVGQGIENTARDVKRMGQGSDWFGNPSTPESRASEIQRMKEESSGYFAGMRESHIGIAPQITTQLADFVAKRVVDETGKLDPDLHGQTANILADMKARSAKGFTVEDLDIFRRRLMKAARTDGEERAKAGVAVEAIDDAFERITEKNAGKVPEWDAVAQNLQQARAQWARAKKFEVISDVLNKAQGDPNKIKVGFNNLLNTKAGKSKIRGFTDEEKAAIKEASENSTIESLLSLGGKFGVDISKGVSGNKLPMWASTMAHFLGAKSKTLAETIGVGTAARKGQKLLATGKGENVLDVIRKGQNPWQKNGLDNALNPQLPVIP